MSLARGIENLQEVVARCRAEGASPGAEIHAGLRVLQTAAAAESQSDLVRLCRAAERALGQRAAAGEPSDAAVIDHLGDVLEYASACALAAEVGGERPVVPPAWPLGESDDHEHFRETLDMFTSQAIGSVAELRDNLRADGVTDADWSPEAMARIRRIVHTLGAEFGVLDLVPAQRLCAEASLAIDAAADRGSAFPVGLVVECADVMGQYLEELTTDVAAGFPDVSGLLVRLRDAAAGDDADVEAEGGVDRDGPAELAVEGAFAESIEEFVIESRSHLLDAEVAMLAFADHADVEHVGAAVRAFHAIRGVAAFLNLGPLVDLADSAETLLDEVGSDRATIDGGDVDMILAVCELLGRLIDGLEGRPMPLKSKVTRLVQRVDAVVAREALRRAPVPVGPSLDDGADEAVSESPQSPASKRVKAERIARVSTGRLDMLVDLVGELVAAQTKALADPAIEQAASLTLARNIAQLERVTRELQAAAMSLCTVTVKPTFDKMARLVRDIGRRAGKQVALTIEGEDVELDRDLAEHITDPLIHMVSNAIDHGIEPVDKRFAAGKNAIGSLSLRASHAGGAIVIEVQDDGRGIDKDELIGRALGQGLLPRGTRAADLSDAEAFELVFRSGLSTAAQATDFSGRGVGMDIVRRDIEALGGKVEIDSDSGRGTTFRMRLPLPLAVVDGMTVRVGDGFYFLPRLHVVESFRPDPDTVYRLAEGTEFVRFDGSALAVHRLASTLGQADGLDQLPDGMFVMVEAGGSRACLFVDEVFGEQHVLIRGSGGDCESTSGISGRAMTADGREALVLDVPSLVHGAVATR